MSGNDKTRQKLVESMRMTKAGSSKAAGDVDTKQNITAQNDKPIKKKKKSVAQKKVVKDTQKISMDPYQTARRVWPD